MESGSASASVTEIKLGSVVCADFLAVKAVLSVGLAPSAQFHHSEFRVWFACPDAYQAYNKD